MDARAVSGRSTVLAILGDPIAHARAPELANEALAARGRDVDLLELMIGFMLPWQDLLG